MAKFISPIPESEQTLEAFENTLGKLKNNRKQVPLDDLVTRYAKAYNALLARVNDYREWYLETYFRTILHALPYYGDEAAALEIIPRWEAIYKEEHRPGGLYDQQKAALFDRQDIHEFYTLAEKLIDRFLDEAYGPYKALHQAEPKKAQGRQKMHGETKKCTGEAEKCA